jgi:WD40 repeat protein
VLSHKNYVSDIQFIPGNVKVDRKNPPPEGKHVHFLSVSEDGTVNIWDTRPVEKEVIRNYPDFIWKPFLQINLFR